MDSDRRSFLKATLVMGAAGPLLSIPDAAQSEIPSNKNLSTIFNRDLDGLLYSSSGTRTSPAEYKRMLQALLEAKPGVLAKNVGMPDPVTYHSKVATTWDKYLKEVSNMAWPGSFKEGEEDHSALALRKLFASGTDCLKLTIEACRERGVVVVASYRMNAEDFYQYTWLLADFGRAHPEWRIPGAGCLDPAIPSVYKQRMEIFTEVANDYDIDGIEFDFRRWTRMISNPRENHPVLTKMVRETREMLNRTARRKGRKKVLLGVRVGPSVADPPGTEYAGGDLKTDISCRELGLDVKTWIEQGLLDYVCPSLFWPRLPGVPKTRDFVELARGKNVGIYPTVFPLPAWAEDAKNPVADTPETRRRHRDEIIRAALQCYEAGADGISTFNWSTYFPPGTIQFDAAKYSENYSRANVGYQKVLMAVHPKLGSPEGLRKFPADSTSEI